MEKQLINAVVRQIGSKDQAIEAGNHGADAGWVGFTYYNDTVAFSKRQRKNIVSLVNEMANEFGQEPTEFVASFRCLKDYLPEIKDSIERYLYGGKMTDSEDDTQIQNAMAWFALEEVGRYLESERN